MNRKGALVVTLLLVIVAEGSDASLFGKFRKMAGIEPGGKSFGTPVISPSPGPISDTRSDPSHVDSDKSDIKSPQDPPVPDNSMKADPKGSGTKDQESPQPESHIEKDKNQGGIDGKCEVSSNRCVDRKNMSACLQHPGNGLQDLFILVQNKGESTLKVNITVPASVKIDLKELEILKHQTKKINFSINVGESPKIVLNAGNGECVLHTGVPVSEGNFFQWIPSYATLVTPIYGAYFFFLIALIVGGTWACCKFGKRGRRGDGSVPYQELEMGIPSSDSAVNVDTVDRWDQGWDDNWDDERAVKSPGGQHVGNVSANGLTSRSSNRDGWENDWDN